MGPQVLMDRNQNSGLLYPIRFARQQQWRSRWVSRFIETDISGHPCANAGALFLPQRNTPAEYAAACVETVGRADWVVIDRNWTNATFHYVFPSMANPQPPEKKRFQRAIESSFALVGRYGNYELRKRAQSDEIFRQLAKARWRVVVYVIRRISRISVEPRLDTGLIQRESRDAAQLWFGVAPAEAS